MVYQIGINGFGRIGRQVYKAIHEGGFGDLFEVTAINDLSDNGTLAHLLKYDSTYGTFDAEVSSDEEGIIVNGKKIRVFEERDPAKLPWGELGVDLVIESTGRFTDAAAARAHIDGGGAKKVIISAPAKGEDITIVLGVNEDKYDPATHHIISNASCTTNCLAPVVKVLHEEIGIERGAITTVHDVTNTQVIVDAPHKDLRRARSALNSLVPTSTGSATAITLIYPELAGKLNGIAVRVPLLNASLTDCVFTLARDVTVEEINARLCDAAGGALRGILGFEDRPLVSADYTNDTRSGIVDGPSTMVIDG
ncbi:MAG: type I glyceraldehyde-3-phosphate dehydrogenase, partial [Thermomicrobiales bacterium]|nr:type I glyceraldehyde-3-phosphate dehydrogenase [Thermomicrobiales bacterium]